MEETDMAETLKSLSVKLDELSNTLGKKKISNVIIEKKDRVVEKIGKKPFAFLGGAFFGGLAIGYLVSRNNRIK